FACEGSSQRPRPRTRRHRNGRCALSGIQGQHCAKSARRNRRRAPHPVHAWLFAHRNQRRGIPRNQSQPARSQIPQPQPPLPPRLLCRPLRRLDCNCRAGSPKPASFPSPREILSSSLCALCASVANLLLGRIIIQCPPLSTSASPPTLTRPRSTPSLNPPSASSRRATTLPRKSKALSAQS